MSDKKNIAIILSGIALIASITALLRCDPMEADWMSVLIGILAILVTALIGLQIYNVIYLEKRVKKVVDEKLKEGFSEFEVLVNQVICAAKLSLLDVFRDDYLKRKDINSYISILIIGLETAIQHGDAQETIDVSLSALMEVLPSKQIIIKIDDRYHNKLETALRKLSVDNNEAYKLLLILNGLNNC